MALAPLALPVRAADRARLWWLRALGPVGRRLVRDRELRVAVGGVAMIAFALALTVAVPLWLLALGPIVWGVPHVLSDVRYLVVRPGLHRRWPLWIALSVPFALLTWTVDPAWGFAGAASAAALARASWMRKAPIVLGLGVLATLAHREAFLSAVIFAHAHNYIGVLWWWAWRPRRRLLHLVPLAALAIGTALLLSGALDSVVIACGGLVSVAGDMDYYFHLGALAPDIMGPLGARLVLAFAFAQAVHYAVWVRLVPDEDRRRETPRTFAATLRSLRADLSWPVLVLVVAIAIGLAVFAAFDLFAARNGYLRAVLFHGHLEVAAAAIFVAEGLRPMRATRAGAP